MKDFLIELWYLLKPALVTIFTVCINGVVKYFVDRDKYKKHLEECKMKQSAPMSFRVFKAKNKPGWLRRGDE